MINPEAIDNCIKGVREAIRGDSGKDIPYLSGKREGFEMCLDSGVESLTIEALQKGIDYYMSDKCGIPCMGFRRGIADAHIVVGRMIQQRCQR